MKAEVKPLIRLKEIATARMDATEIGHSLRLANWGHPNLTVDDVATLLDEMSKRRALFERDVLARLSRIEALIASAAPCRAGGWHDLAGESYCVKCGVTPELAAPDPARARHVQPCARCASPESKEPHACEMDPTASCMLVLGQSAHEACHHYEPEPNEPEPER